MRNARAVDIACGESVLVCSRCFDTPAIDCDKMSNDAVDTPHTQKIMTRMNAAVVPFIDGFFTEEEFLQFEGALHLLLVAVLIELYLANIHDVAFINHFYARFYACNISWSAREGLVLGCIVRS